MRRHDGDASPSHVGLRITGTVVGALLLPPILLAFVRPGIIAVAMLQESKSAAGL